MCVVAEGGAGREGASPDLCVCVWLQRAALAEREAMTLKEQLAASHERAQTRPGESSGAGLADSAAEPPRPASGGGHGAREKEVRRATSLYVLNL